MRKAGWLRLVVFCLAGMLGLAETARADTIVNFTFVNVGYVIAYGGNSLTGTVDIDVTTGEFEAIQATYGPGAPTVVFTGGGGGGSSTGAVYHSTQVTPANFTAALFLDVEADSLVGFTGGNLINVYNNDPSPYDFGSGIDFVPNYRPGNGFDLSFDSGSLVPTASLSAVPEPSTWVLTGTALLGGLGGLLQRGRRCAAVLNFCRTSGG